MYAHTYILYSFKHSYLYPLFTVYLDTKSRKSHNDVNAHEKASTWCFKIVCVDGNVKKSILLPFIREIHHILIPRKDLASWGEECNSHG